MCGVRLKPDTESHSTSSGLRRATGVLNSNLDFFFFFKNLYKSKLQGAADSNRLSGSCWTLEVTSAAGLLNFSLMEKLSFDTKHHFLIAVVPRYRRVKSRRLFPHPSLHNKLKSRGDSHFTVFFVVFFKFCNQVWCAEEMWIKYLGII